MLSSFIIVLGFLLLYTLLTGLVMFIFAIDDFIFVLCMLVGITLGLFAATIIVASIRGVI